MGKRLPCSASDYEVDVPSIAEHSATKMASTTTLLLTNVSTLVGTKACEKLKNVGCESPC